jgi:UDPglucose--hexose-1-phosphate uridylyltransferase
VTNVRRNLITGRPSLSAPARSLRPHAFGEPFSADERCPFCPGNEADTPPEICRTGDPWRIRVVPNKYPPAPGSEVIIETAVHDDAFASIDHGIEVVNVYLERLKAHREAPAVSLFKNEGHRAGASLPHVHSQLVPLPFEPPRIAEERNAFRIAKECPLCTAIESHCRQGLVIQETATFTWLVPSATSMPFQQWIVPNRHRQDFGSGDEDEVADLAMLLRSAAKASRHVADAFNWVFVSFGSEPASHCYIDVMPRLTALAGLELGTGTFVEIIEPAAAAVRLRNAGPE